MAYLCRSYEFLNAYEFHMNLHQLLVWKIGSFCLRKFKYDDILLLCEISNYFSDQDNLFSSRKQYHIRESQYYYVNIMWKQFLQNFVAITVVIILELELCYLQFSFIYSIAYLSIFYVSKNVRKTKWHNQNHFYFYYGFIFLISFWYMKFHMFHI